MSKRNNLDRVGTPKMQDTGPPPQMTMTPGADALNFVIPTEFVELPSKGMFYPEGHPLHNKEEVEIKFMTAKEEDLLTSRPLLRKGLAIDRVLQSIIVDKRVHIDDLFIGDKNAMIVAARISAYGSEYSVKIPCPACGVSEKFEFNLEDYKVKYSDDIEDTDATNTGNGTFVTTLPKTKVEVEMRLLNGHDEKKISQLNKKDKDLEFSLVNQMKYFIVSVNGVGDRATVNKFIDVMPAYDSKYLRSVYTEIMPTIDLTQNYECSSCGHEQEMEVPFTSEFFWPK
jgi:predicted RNA-binding Zn-ribbon protein involved in translation (DUF1610 family)